MPVACTHSSRFKERHVSLTFRDRVNSTLKTAKSQEQRRLEFCSPWNPSVSQRNYSETPTGFWQAAAKFNYKRRGY